MGKGFIIDQNSDKIGEFKRASRMNSSMWSLEDVTIHKDYFNVIEKTTNSPFLFILAEEMDDVGDMGESAFAVTDSIGVGFMFSDEAAPSWCSVDNVVIANASFIKNQESGYEN